MSQRPGMPTPKEATVTDVTKTPEFLAAVKAATASMRDEILIDLQAALTKAPAAASGDETLDLMRKVALSFAEISDQGTNRKRVAPEILASREAAKERMGTLILKARSLPTADRPRYKLIAKCYLKERLVEPFQRRPDKSVVQTEIYWTNAPNTAMRPVNDSAKAIYVEFMTWIGGKEAIAGMVSQPLWITDKGAVLANPTASMKAVAMAADVFDLDGEPVPAGGNGAEEDLEFVDAADPRRPEIHVLGTVAAPARRLVPGERVQH